MDMRDVVCSTVAGSHFGTCFLSRATEVRSAGCNPTWLQHPRVRWATCHRSFRRTCTVHGPHGPPCPCAGFLSDDESVEMLLVLRAHQRYSLDACVLDLLARIQCGMNFGKWSSLTTSRSVFGGFAGDRRGRLGGGYGARPGGHTSARVPRHPNEAPMPAPYGSRSGGAGRDDSPLRQHRRMSWSALKNWRRKSRADVDAEKYLSGTDGYARGVCVGGGLRGAAGGD